MSLAALLFDDDGDREEVVVTAGDDQRTRGQLQQQTAALADDLAARGVAVGDVVGVQLPSGPDVVAALFAVCPAPYTRREEPPHDLHPPRTDGIVQILARTGTVAIDGERKASNANSGHVLLLLTRCAGTYP